ncbi:MAG TPA: hypothetical protein VMV92_32490 [Streptosporangiaceae bacterium]|nr:hypothetical protein [Streptosporangiaceae bacterium]
MGEMALLRVPVGDGAGDVIEVQVSRADLDGLEESGVVLGVVLAASNGRRFDAASFSLATAVDHVMPALRAIVGRLRGGVLDPDEVTMQVGSAVRRGDGVLFRERHRRGKRRGNDDLAQGGRRASGACG